ncbi:MAG TPA: hypothetical protein VNF07_11230 [Acidimicrobiales bacterium]|nr:hypothetical protein [Acidimicrobiales bacterium]
MSGRAALPARDAVRSLLAGGASYEEVARRLGVRPGLAYLIATGVPADSTDGLSPEDLARPGLLTDPQPLVSPPVHAPDRGPHIRAFIRRRLQGEERVQP